MLLRLLLLRLVFDLDVLNIWSIVQRIFVCNIYTTVTCTIENIGIPSKQFQCDIKSWLSRADMSYTHKRYLCEI